MRLGRRRRRRLRRREDGEGLFARFDQSVLLPGQPLDLGISLEVLDLLVELVVFVGEDAEAGLGRGETALLRQIGAAREHKEKQDAAEDN
jgi:hypothetical protein